MIYFPWDQEGKLKADVLDFDHGPYERMMRYAPDFEVQLWTLKRAEEFAEENYPDIGKLMWSLAHPTMMVDVLRWLVVYHFGGIYWQYDMNPLVPMTRMLPPEECQVRLFTECVVDDAWCREVAQIPIRRGEPEEPIRVCNQAFSATPRQPFIKRVLDLIVERATRLTPQEDYDILYICANAAVSTAYDRYGKDDPAIDLVPEPETRRMMKIQYRGSWRRGKSVAGSQSVRER